MPSTAPDECAEPAAAVSPAAAAPAAIRPEIVETEMRNVDLHLADGVVLSIRALRGRLVSTRKGAFPIFDQRNSFTMQIDAAEIGMSMASLETLLNEHAFGYPKAPLKRLRVSTQGDLLEQKGLLHKGVDIPFKVKGALEATPDGRIRVHPESIKAGGLPVQRLMKVLGVEMDELVKVQEERGVSVHDNDFILDPERILPPPRIRGRVQSVRIEDDEVVQVFGSGPPTPKDRLQPPAISRNYMYFRGGLLRFGKLTMQDADLELIDMDPSDPFDFDLDRYNEQLVAGYSKNTPVKGLKTHMPDRDDLGKRSTGRAAEPPAAPAGEGGSR